MLDLLKKRSLGLVCVVAMSSVLLTACSGGDFSGERPMLNGTTDGMAFYSQRTSPMIKYSFFGRKSKKQANKMTSMYHASPQNTNEKPVEDNKPILTSKTDSEGDEGKN